MELAALAVGQQLVQLVHHTGADDHILGNPDVDGVKSQVGGDITDVLHVTGDDADVADTLGVEPLEHLDDVRRLLIAHIAELIEVVQCMELIAVGEDSRSLAGQLEDDGLIAIAIVLRVVHIHHQDMVTTMLIIAGTAAGAMDMHMMIVVTISLRAVAAGAEGGQLVDQPDHNARESDGEEQRQQEGDVRIQPFHIALAPDTEAIPHLVQNIAEEHCHLLDADDDGIHDALDVSAEVPAEVAEVEPLDLQQAEALGVDNIVGLFDGLRRILNRLFDGDDFLRLELVEDILEADEPIVNHLLPLLFVKALGENHFTVRLDVAEGAGLGVHCIHQVAQQTVTVHIQGVRSHHEHDAPILIVGTDEAVSLVHRLGLAVRQREDHQAAGVKLVLDAGADGGVAILLQRVAAELLDLAVFHEPLHSIFVIAALGGTGAVLNERGLIGNIATQQILSLVAERQLMSLGTDLSLGLDVGHGLVVGDGLVGGISIFSRGQLFDEPGLVSGMHLICRHSNVVEGRAHHAQEQSSDEADADDRRDQAGGDGNRIFAIVDGGMGRMMFNIHKKNISFLLLDPFQLILQSLTLPMKFHCARVTVILYIIYIIPYLVNNFKCYVILCLLSIKKQNKKSAQILKLYLIIRANFFITTIFYLFYT